MSLRTPGFNKLSICLPRVESARYTYLLPYRYKSKYAEYRNAGSFEAVAERYPAKLASLSFAYPSWWPISWQVVNGRINSGTVVFTCASPENGL